jgi:hypothetical protein
MLRYIPELLESAMRGEITSQLFHVFSVSSVNVVGIPLWANFTRLGYLVTVYAGGMALAFWMLLRRDSFPPQLRAIGAWALVVGATSFAAVVLSRGGEEFRRFLLYGSLFTSPLLVAILGHYFGWRIPLAGLAVALLVVATPTALVNGNLVSTLSFYPEQTTAGRFLGRFGSPGTPGERFNLYDVGAGEIGWYYVPFATRTIGGMLELGGSQPQQTFLQASFRHLLSLYTAPASEGVAQVLWIDPSKLAQYHQWFGRDEAARVLQPVYAGADKTRRIYDNGMVQLLTSG